MSTFKLPEPVKNEHGDTMVLMIPDPFRRTDTSHTFCKGCGTELAKCQLRSRRDGAENWGWCHACR